MTGYCLPADRDHADDGDEGSALGLAGLSAALLQRHDARVLDPSAAATIPDSDPPRSTVYRARTLLVPVHLLDQSLAALNDVLVRVGMHLRRLADVGAPDEFDLPELAVLVPAEEEREKKERSALPVVVDAWVALQALRAATRLDGPLHGDREEIMQISLEHILTGAALNGAPITDGGGLMGGPITDGGSITGPGAADSYVFGGGDTRTPVKLYLDPPPRLSPEECNSRYGRRPVVAVLDTGERPHPWLQAGQFLGVDMPMQAVIFANGQTAQNAGDKHRQLINGPLDTPVTAAPLVGELDTHTGHGTFIAGIVRQVVPNAEVLAIRVMHSDGIVYEGDLLCALWQIAKRVQNAQGGVAGAQADMTQMVDVISLSMGYFSESPTAKSAGANSALCKVIQRLAKSGVAVVAAAGNSSTRRRFYPAAFTEVVTTVNGVDPVYSVGALNPNGTTAIFSNGGHWVRAWASGAEVVSTFPVDVDGSRQPELGMPKDPANPLPADVPPGVLLRPGRDALDPDDYAAGFAVWSGTSFATPEVASQFVKRLIEVATGAAGGGPLPLDQAGQTAAVNRMTAAVGLVNGFWE